MFAKASSIDHHLPWRLSSLLVVAGLVLAACGGNATAQPSNETELRIGYDRIEQTDPALISSDAEVSVANAVYDYLVDVDANNEIQPRLAKSWDVSDDGLTYSFNLVQNAVFHDGSPLTAADVLWTFNRLRDPDSGFATVELYSDIESIEATGDHQVTFTLSTTNPFFLFDLSDNHALIVKDGTQDATDFNGTGPFVVDNYSPEDRIELSANPDYFMDGQPGVDKLTYIFFSDRAAAVDALRTDQVDLVMQLPTPIYQSLEGQQGITRFQVATNAFPVVRLRADQPPGDDPRVMQAMRKAIDRQEIFQLVQQEMGAVGRDTPIGPLYGSFYTEEIPLPERDVEGAKQLLADAGYPDGLDLTLRLPDAQNFPDLAVVLKNQLADAGFNIDVSVEPESVYYGDNGWLDATFGITGWGSRPYPQFYLDVMLVCGAKWNESHFCDSEFDSFAETAGTATNEQEQVNAYFQIQQILIERGPIIVPFFFPQLGAQREVVQGFQMKAFPGRSDLRTVTINQ
ncbi:MAG: ABC transporter substrate-binding protein [Anaerolineales bacterium]